MANYLKGKAAILTAYQNQRSAFPLWKLHDTSQQQKVLYENITETDPVQSSLMLENTLNKLKPDSMYCLNLFKPGRKTYGMANASLIFINEDYNLVNGVTDVPLKTKPPEETKQVEPIARPHYDNRIDPPAPSERIGLSDHIQLIQKCSMSEAKLMYVENIVKDQAREISELKLEIEKLENEVQALEFELEDQEEEEEAVSGEDAPVTMESALAGLIKENGAVIIENLMNGKLKDAPTFENVTEENNNFEQEQDKAHVTGVDTVSINSYSIEQLNEVMLSINPKWKNHLLKLVLIGKHRPITFKKLINQLENF